MKFKKLTIEEADVIEHKGTEAPFTGQYNLYSEKGTYLCKKCGTPLFYSQDKFESNCGWPSFDDAIPHSINKTIDRDGIRIEITCAHCNAHLGHIFTGEAYTKKNTRYCVNSIALDFSSL